MAYASITGIVNYEARMIGADWAVFCVEVSDEKVNSLVNFTIYAPDHLSHVAVNGAKEGTVITCICKIIDNKTKTNKLFIVEEINFY